MKELGLTESLEVGYRLSPRGRAVLARSSLEVFTLDERLAAAARKECFALIDVLPKV